MNSYFAGIKDMDKSHPWAEKIAPLIILGGLLVLAFFRPLISGITWDWSNTYSQILILFLLFVWLGKMAVQGEFVFRRTPLDIPILLFSLALIISVFNSVNKEVSFRQLYQFLSYPALYFIIVNNLGEKLTPRQKTTLVFSLTLIIALAGAVWLRGIGLPLFSALAPALMIIAVSIPLLRSPKITRGGNTTIHSILLPLMLIVVVLVSLYGIYQRYWGLERTRQAVQQMQIQFPPAFLARLAGDRIFSTFVFPPALAGYLAIVLPLALAFFIFARSGWPKVLPGLTLILGGFCLWLTFSEGGWISFALAVFLLIFILSGPGRRRLLLLSLPILGGLFLILLLSGFLPEINWEGFLGSAQVRFDYWRAGLGMIKEFPLFGSGLGTFGNLYPRFKLPFAEETRLAHNNYLQIWIETGILGIISFLWLWVAFLRAGWKIANRQSLITNHQSPTTNHHSPFTIHYSQKAMVIGCYVGVVAFLLHSLVDFGLYVQGIATYVWLFMGIVIATRDYKSELTPSSFPLPSGESIKACPALDVRMRGKKKFLDNQVISYKLVNPWARTGVALVIVLIIIFLMVTVGKPLAAERHFQQSSVYLTQGAVGRGVKYLRKAIRANPRKGAYRFRLGHIYRKKGLLDKAINQFRQAIERDPFMPHYRSTLGKVLWEKAQGRDEGLMEEAVRKFEKARDLFPARAKYRVLLGRIYELRGRKEEARQEFDKVLKLEHSLEEAETARAGMKRLKDK